MARYDEDPNYQFLTPAGLFNQHYDAMTAPGSPGADAAATAGPVIGNPVISTVGISSQMAEGRPTVTVHSGDTASFSDDLAAHVSPIMPGPQPDYMSTGAGQGSGHDVHPNAGA